MLVQHLSPRSGRQIHADKQLVAHYTGSLRDNGHVLIELSPTSPGGLEPELEPYLSRYAVTRFHHLERCLRPPLGIYNTSLGQVWPAFIAVLDRADEIIRDRPFEMLREPGWDVPFVDALERLLYVLFEHIEDNENILRCCFATDAGFQKHEATKGYRQAIKRYRDRLGRAVNAMKHEQARIRPVILHSSEFVAHARPEPARP